MYFIYLSSVSFHPNISSVHCSNQCQTQCRHLVNTCWVNECVNCWMWGFYAGSLGGEAGKTWKFGSGGTGPWMPWRGIWTHLRYSWRVLKYNKNLGRALLLMGESGTTHRIMGEGGWFGSGSRLDRTPCNTSCSLFLLVCMKHTRKTKSTFSLHHQLTKSLCWTRSLLCLRRSLGPGHNSRAASSSRNITQATYVI